VRIRRALVIGCALCLAAAACGTILDLQPPPDQSTDGGSRDGTMPGDTGTDGHPTDALVDTGADDTATDAGTDSGSSSCAPLDAALPDGATDVATVFNPMAQVVIDDAGDFSWQFFDTTNLGFNVADFTGGVFDGQYVYFSPANSGTVVRYDTSMPFQKAAFEIFDTTTLPAPQAESYGGAVFDGRFVYFVPRYGHGNSYPGLVVRFDTRAASLATATAWSVFDTTTLPAPDGGPTVRGFAGSVFDGRYVYLVPDSIGNTPVSRVARYDTMSTDGGTSPAGDAGDAGPPHFATAADWETFDTTTQDPSARGFIGGVYDGRYVYLIPYVNGGATNLGASGVISRYDTTGQFTSGGSWSSFDLVQVNSKQGVAFFGGAFDRRYVYLVPFNRTLALRFDTTANLGLANIPSWAGQEDLTKFVTLPDGAAPEFAGGAFDGRFVYYVPHNSGLVVRYDTIGDCWSWHNVKKDNGGATDFHGAIYDGRWLYLEPVGSVIARFDTKSADWLPNVPGSHGSFY
jgi:hypothetical protein